MNADKTRVDDLPETESVSPTGNTLVDSLLTGVKYTADGEDGEGTTLTFSFPTSESVFSSTEGGYPLDDDEPDVGLEGLDADEQAIARDALDHIETFSNLSFVEVTETETDAGIIRFAWTGIEEEDSVAWAYLPGRYEAAGDVWLLSSSGHSIEDPDFGQTITHELGHGLGLKHPHTAEGDFPELDDSLDGAEYTIMTYNVSARHPDAVWADLFPTGYMYLDILALQELYGVDTATTGGSDSYVFDTDSRYYETIWDAGGLDSITISGSAKDVDINLTPGSWSNVGTVIEYWDGSDFWTESDSVYIAPGVLIERVFAGDGNDSVTGNAADNLLAGNGGADHIVGGDGADTLRGNAGADTLHGGDDDDKIWAGAGDDGGDQMNGGTGDDTMGGGAGDDTMTGELGSDVAYGGDGDDLLIGGMDTNGTQDTAGNQLWGGAGNDVIDGAAGHDSLGGGQGDDILNAMAGNDVLYGGSTGNDVMTGGAGEDRIFAGIGNDAVSGDDGVDVVFGGLGDDAITGGAGADTLYGGAGNDTITGGEGDDTLRPSVGDDVLIFASGSGDDFVSGFEVGNDTIDISEAETNFTNAASVTAAASADDQGLTIDLGGGDSVFLKGLTLDDIDMMTFIF